MINLRAGLVLLLSAGLAISCATDQTGGGGTVEVSYQSPDQFTDMGRSYTALQGADPGYLNDLREYIERAGSQRVRAGYRLSLTITDVDLAGQFEPEHGPQFQDVRIVRSIYPPRITLNYRLMDSTGAVRSQGERRLIDNSFEFTATPINRDDPLRYEKALIDSFLREMANQSR
ncbi:MAG: DUF3016 domain-containing protein [Opitutus sp.]